MFDVPEVRVRRTKHAKPSLASQAPKVRIISTRKACVKARREEDTVMKKAKDKIIASSDRSAIRIWCRWETIVRIGAKHIKGDKENKVIALRVDPVFGLQDRCLILSF
jgi:hypothetical protein